MNFFSTAKTRQGGTWSPTHWSRPRPQGGAGLGKNLSSTHPRLPTPPLYPPELPTSPGGTRKGLPSPTGTPTPRGHARKGLPSPPGATPSLRSYPSPLVPPPPRRDDDRRHTLRPRGRGEGRAAWGSLENPMSSSPSCPSRPYFAASSSAACGGKMLFPAALPPHRVQLAAEKIFAPFMAQM